MERVYGQDPVFEFDSKNCGNVITKSRGPWSSEESAVRVSDSRLSPGQAMRRRDEDQIDRMG